MFRYERWKIEILEMDNLRIARLRLTEPVSNLLYGSKQTGLER